MLQNPTFPSMTEWSEVMLYKTQEYVSFYLEKRWSEKRSGFGQLFFLSIPYLQCQGWKGWENIYNKTWQRLFGPEEQTTQSFWVWKPTVLPLEKSNYQHTQMFPFILPCLWPAPTLSVHLSLLYLLFLLTHPCFYLWMSCPWITGACGGLSEPCVEVWRRLLGSPSSSCSPLFLPKSPSQWGRKTLVQRQKLIGFLQDIIFHWMDKQENFSPLKRFSIKYRSQLENWIAQPPFRVSTELSRCCWTISLWFSPAL